MTRPIYNHMSSPFGIISLFSLRSLLFLLFFLAVLLSGTIPSSMSASSSEVSTSLLRASGVKKNTFSAEGLGHDNRPFLSMQHRDYNYIDIFVNGYPIHELNLNKSH